ncbi:MAG: type I-E CRISPR-associated protein Cse1/CasA [Meiothermus sp.]|uniref:type I-E CRISPR-associated protein Cse1/CasA n=1 Tax=Meiothermus sp. TaxID=1955249 RepID=UPI00298EEA5A|nr:type I-E CRISPR-associated protein Cse1/CasA [Meiothermus sp.]MDW8481394.1 type I-E CRISPR-associated protein Cse1/CasA [Meiothermus sp.]
MYTFNLITQPWIPVREGSALRLVGLEEALLEARRFARIEDPSPLVTVALHRLLLAILHRALEGPEDAYVAAKWFSDGFDAQKIRDYLARYQDRFDLFHPQKPFYQVPDFSLKRSSRSWTVLAPELNSDNNKVLFDHTIVANPRPLPPDEAARLLVANQTFALSAGKSVLCHTATAPVATAALVVVLGENLHQTLCLNLVSYPQEEYQRDTALWEQDPFGVSDLEDCNKARATPRGIVHRYTWLSRAVRLEPETLNGQTIVRWVAYASGLRYEEASIRPDPMVAFRTDPKDSSKRYTLAFREDRALWRDFTSLLPRPQGGHSPAVVQHARNLYRALGSRYGSQGIPVLVGGLANDQAKVEFWRAELYRLPGAVLGDKDVWTFIQENLERAEEIGKALEAAARALAEHLLTVGERKPKGEDVKNLARSFPHKLAFWSGLKEHFGRWLQDIDASFDRRQGELQESWLQALREQALKAWQLTALAAGDDARALRAVHKSEGILLSKLPMRKEAIGASTD